MRLTIALLGYTFDLSLEPTADEPETEDADDQGAALNGGTTTSYPLAFTGYAGDQRWQPSPELE